MELGGLSFASSKQNRGRFNFFQNSRIGGILETTSITAPVEVNVTKTMQMHTDDKVTHDDNAQQSHISFGDEHLPQGKLS